MTDKDISDRVTLHELKTLSDNHYILRQAEFDFRRSDGAWQTLKRESYDLGDAAVVLPLDRVRGRVLLIRQFRWPAFEWGYRQLLIEAIAGKLDGDTPRSLRHERGDGGSGCRHSRPAAGHLLLHQSRRGEGEALAVPGRL